MPPKPLKSLARWIVAVTWSFGLGGLAYDATESLPDWPAGFITFGAFLFAMWVFGSLFYLGGHEDGDKTVPERDGMPIT